MRIATAWISFAVVWLVLAGEVSLSEVVAAAAAGVAAAGAVELVRMRPASPRTRVTGAWLASLRGLPYAVLRDFAKLAVGAFRPGSALAELREVPKPDGPSGLVALAGSTAANEIVVEVDAGRKRLVVHRLRG